MNSKTIESIKKFDIKNPDLWSALREKVWDLKVFLIGLVILVGSIGLILGAFTCAVASIAIVFFAVSLVPAMLIGFFSVGVISLCVGFVILYLSIPKR